MMTVRFAVSGFMIVSPPGSTALLVPRTNIVDVDDRRARLAVERAALGERDRCERHDLREGAMPARPDSGPCTGKQSRIVVPCWGAVSRVTLPPCRCMVA